MDSGTLVALWLIPAMIMELASLYLSLLAMGERFGFETSCFEDVCTVGQVSSTVGDKGLDLNHDVVFCSEKRMIVCDEGLGRLSDDEMEYNERE